MAHAQIAEKESDLWGIFFPCRFILLVLEAVNNQ